MRTRSNKSTYGKLAALAAVAACASAYANEVKLDASPDRVKTPLTVGMVNDMFIERGNDDCEDAYARKATQADFDAF